MKNIIILIVGLLLIGLSVYLLIVRSANIDVSQPEVPNPDTASTTTETTIELEEVTDSETSSEEEPRGETTVLGRSVQGKEILAYHYGTGSKELLLIGGIHGGYSWNTALLAYQLQDWLKATPEVIPENFTITIIPNLNPDGLMAITKKDGQFEKADVSGTEAQKVAARFNANQVDLNRNFDCLWKETGRWRDQNVKAGTMPFSEPETLALKNYVERNKPYAVVAWYSASGGVYASACENGILPLTKSLTGAYAAGANYPAYDEYDYYEITGDMMNWFAKIGVPAISVLLTSHEETELLKNQAGLKFILSLEGRQ